MSQLILSSGYDIMAGWASGALKTPINVMYVGFTNDPGLSASPPNFDDDIAAYFNSLPANRDYLRVPILSQPSTVSTNEQTYAGNQAIFVSITQSGTGVLGIDFQSAGPGTEASRVIEAALVVAPSIGDPEQDRIFAYTLIEPAIPRGDGTQIAVQWAQTFKHEE